MKSKEPKHSKEKKSEAKSRTVGEKRKRTQTQAAADPLLMPAVFASGEAANGSINGAASPSSAVLEAAPIEVIALESGPLEEMIRMRAYELFVDRGCEHGRQLEDWLAAERELKHKHRAA